VDRCDGPRYLHTYRGSGHLPQALGLMLTRLCFVASSLALAACADTQLLRPGRPVALKGTVGYSSCPTTDLYKESFPSLTLLSPANVQGIGRVDVLDMPLSEYNLINYSALVGKTAHVTCVLEISHFCSTTQSMAMCSQAKIEAPP